ncbi:hypothetical protein BDV12DRAFT_11938 [Aspergillus spectabilis]
MTFDLPLANGHLLNLQPRPRRDKGAMLYSDAGDIRNGAVEIGTRSDKNDSDADTSESPGQLKPTRLPVLKVFTDHSERKGNAISPKQKMQGAAHGSVEYEPPKSTDEERERYWRRIRDRLDRDSPPSRNKEKQKATHNGAYRKIISLASSPRQELAKHKLKYSGGSPNEKSGTPNASPAAKKINSSPERRNSSRESTPSRQSRFSNVKGRTNSNHSASSSGTGSSSRKYRTDSTTDSTYNSNSSVSPVSGPSASMKEWEDKFVVHMPSAREPNPPTLNVQQISEYQRSIEKVQNEGGSMVDPDTLPSPRTTTPEDHLKFPEQSGKRLGTLDGQDSRPSSSHNEDDSGPANFPSHRRYYCPDEIGKQRFSTIWEESSIAPKQKPTPTNSDGSFLGCKEINGPHDRNPDEILFFSTPERPKVVNIPSRMPRLPRDPKPAALRQMKRASGETTLVQEEWEPISRNLKHAQCSKPSPKALCRDTQCQQTKTKKSASPEAKDGRDSTGKQTGSSENTKSDPREDDVFIITPTITRTMVTMTDLRGQLHRHHAVREPTARSAGEIITDARTRLPINTKTGVSPSGLRRVSQNSWENSSAPSATALDTGYATNISVVKTRADPKITATEKSVAVDKRRGMRGFIRTPGIPRSATEFRIDTPLDRPLNSAASSPSARVSSLPLRRTTPISPEARNSRPTSKATSSPPPTNSPSRIRGTMQAKIVDVAELDGHQVDDHRESDSGSKVSSSHDHQLIGIQSDTKALMSSETLHMLIDMVFLFVAQVQGFFRQIKTNRGSKVVLLKVFLNGILGMLEHCLRVLRKGLAILSTYNSTGVWPEANDKNLAWTLTEFGQALVYLIVLGFVAMIIARAVGVVVLVGTWIVWLARPFAIAFRTVARVLSL